jgi:hypothetical protein
MAKPRAPKPPKPPREWARESPGRYRSSDERFTIEQEGGGRWFLIDAQQHDELGLERTLGPYDTLDAARAAAGDQREAPPEESPLRERLAEAAARPRLKVMKGGRRTDARDDTDDAPEADEPAPPPPAKKSWLDRLPAADARRARTLIEALESLGVEKAEQVVRRDMDGNTPAVATSVLARALGRAALTPPEGREIGRAAARLERAGASAEDVAAYTRLVAEDVLDRALEVLSARERDQEAPSRLPGWRLVEGEGEGSSGRRLILSADEVIRAGE